MTSMRSALLTVLFVLSAAIAPVEAVADPLPIYDGDMTFQAIQGPDGPEEFSWEVTLYEGQELQAVDERHAAVYYADLKHIAFSIEAEVAHDADGATVPTTLSVTQPNVITLTVHHRDGNPAADGAPFNYPILPGAGWEGGFQTVEIEGPPDEAELRRRAMAPGAALAPEPTLQCHVPDLTGRTLRASRRILHRADCKLGQVHGERSRGARVETQYRLTGKVLPAWTAVDVRILKVVQSTPARG
jgi:hypothetical protein